MISSFPSIGPQVIQRHGVAHPLPIPQTELTAIEPRGLGFVVLLLVSLCPTCLKVPCRVTMR